MKTPVYLTNILLAICLASWIKPLLGQQNHDSAIVVMTYNIRLNTPDDGVNAWPNRKEKVIELVNSHQPSVFGLQEVLADQLNDFEHAFPYYKRIGVGRDDGKEAGEFSPIFFDSKRFSSEAYGTFWLSGTPSIPGSRGWDAACNRIVTWVKLRDVPSDIVFFVFNTHFDHQGRLARRNSAFLLVHAVDSIAGKYPVVITGDFNSTPDSEPVFIMTGRVKPWQMLTDSRSLCKGRTGPVYTYTGFEVGKIPGQMIDFIFLKKIPAVLSHRVVDQNDGKYYPSDHLPVVVKLIF
jgi:endonuclease/exonuclease/phosphatase family metal-dependent hydrolase